MNTLTLIATLLRSPRDLLDAAEDPERLAWMVPRLLAVLIVGAMVFGAVVGAYRGGIQLGYAALKMPLLFLIPPMVGLPAIRALCVVSDVEVSWSRLGVASLAGAARGAVLAAALGPVLWLLYSVTTDYHYAVLLLAAAVGAVGLPGLGTIALAIPRTGTVRVLAALGTVGVLGLVTAQTGWLLRPFVARPTVEVALFRSVEEDVVSSLAATAQSATGHYPEWEAEAVGLAGRGLRKERR